jgi:hypothetical protein
MKNTLEAKMKQGYTHVVVWGYDSGTHRSGEIVSHHKSYEAAEKKANQSTMWGIRDIREAYGDSGEGVC